MIKGSLSELTSETVIDNKINSGLNYLKNTNISELKDGKYVISDNMYVNIQTYTTKNDADYEAHRLYADIQYIISGEENIGVTDYSSCSTTKVYNEESDIEFLKGDGEYINLKEGEYLILYPEDAHKPSISVDKLNPAKVRKAVVKIKL